MIVAPENTRARASAALHILDNLPQEDSPDTRKALADAIEQLVRLRDELITAARAGEPCQHQLRAVNVVLSSIFGTEFSVHGMQWKRVCETRDAIRHWMDGAQVDASI